MTARGPWDAGASTRIPRVRPRGGTEVDVWLIHPGPKPDYYETVFDFARFVEATREGAPRLTVWTGRDDLDRAGLRATLRRIVTAEADAARAQFAAGKPPEDDPANRRALGFVLTLAAQGTLLAMRATPVGLAVSALIGAAGLVLATRGAGEAPEQDEADRLEAEIARVQAATDAALRDLRLRVHPELSGGLGEREAWPIPAVVRALMRTAGER